MLNNFDEYIRRKTYGNVLAFKNNNENIKINHLDQDGRQGEFIDYDPSLNFTLRPTTVHIKIELMPIWLERVDCVDCVRKTKSYIHQTCSDDD